MSLFCKFGKTKQKVFQNKFLICPFCKLKLCYTNQSLEFMALKWTTTWNLQDFITFMRKKVGSFEFVVYGVVREYFFHKKFFQCQFVWDWNCQYGNLKLEYEKKYSLTANIPLKKLLLINNFEKKQSFKLVIPTEFFSVGQKNTRKSIVEEKNRSCWLTIKIKGFLLETFSE